MDSAAYPARAAFCRQRAQECTSIDLSEQWKHMADDWDIIARIVNSMKLADTIILASAEMLS